MVMGEEMGVIPWMMARFGCDGREDEDGLRARTVTEWPRERALERTMRPLRPVAPETKMCIVCWGGAGGGEVSLREDEQVS